MKYYSLIIACLSFSLGYAQMDWPEGKKAAVVLTYDDGVKSHLQVAVPQLEARNMRGTFFLFGQTIRSSDVTEWRNVSSRGHELGNHSIFHPCLQETVAQSSSICRSLECYTVKEMLEEISIMNHFLYAIDGKESYSYAYPCGQYTAGGEDYSKPLIQSGLAKYARGGIGGIITDIHTLDMSKIPVLSIPEGCRAEQLTGFVEEIVEQKGLGIFVFHGVGGDYLAVDEQEHARFLDYLDRHSGEIWITTFSEAMDWIASGK